MKSFLKLILFLQITSFVAAHPGHDDGDTVPANTQPPAKNHVSIRIEGEDRWIDANGIPEHLTGKFPNAGNPNSIREQNYHYRVPAKPKVAEKITPLGHQSFGIAINGVVFDPGTAEFWRNDRSSPWNYEAIGSKMNLGLDANHAHVQPNGAYHYHGIPTPLDDSSGGKEKMTLLGWAADGFPIYGPQAPSDAKNLQSTFRKMKSGYRIKKGNRPGGQEGPGGTYDGTFTADYEYVAGSGDLDECNGRIGVTPEFSEGIYYYVLTEEFPFIPRFFKGTPDKSFQRRGPPAGGPPGGRPPRDGPPDDGRPPPDGPPPWP